MFRIQICSMDAYEFLLLISYFLKELEYDKKEYLNMLALYGADQFFISMKDLATGLATAKLTKVVPDRVQLYSELNGYIKERKNELANMAHNRYLIGPL